MKPVNEKYFTPNSNQQNTIDDLLTDGEKVLWRGKPKRKAYVWGAVLKMMPIALLWLAIDAVFVALAFTLEGAPDFLPWLLIPFFLLHLAPVWIWIANIIKAVGEIKRIEYAITDKRIIVRSGLVGVDFKTILHAEVDSVNVRRGIVDKICKVGDVYVNAKQNAVVLNDLPDPYFVAKNLQQIAYDVKTDVQFPNALRPQQNDGYPTQYTGDVADDTTNDQKKN